MKQTTPGKRYNYERLGQEKLLDRGPVIQDHSKSDGRAGICGRGDRVNATKGTILVEKA